MQRQVPAEWGPTEDADYGGVTRATWKRYTHAEPTDVCFMRGLDEIEIPEALLQVKRHGFEYAISAQFRGGRGTREIARDQLSNILKCASQYVQEGLPMGPLHVPERAHVWTELVGSRRVTSPSGDVRICPFPAPNPKDGRLYHALLHVPDHGVRVLNFDHDPENLEAAAYSLAAITEFPCAAVRVAGFRHKFKVSNREGEFGYAAVGNGVYTLVPLYDELGDPCVAVEFAAQVPLRGRPVRRLAVYPLAEVQLRDVLWSEEDESVSSYSRPSSASSASSSAAPSPSSAPRPAAQPPRSRYTGSRASPAPVPTDGTGPDAGADASRSVDVAPAGMDPLVWEGLLLQLQSAATLRHDSAGRPLHAVDMRSSMISPLLAIAREGQSIQGSARELRSRIEEGAGVRLHGGHSTFKSSMAIFAKHSDLCRTLARNVRGFPFAELYRADAPLAIRLRAYAKAARGLEGRADHVGRTRAPAQGATTPEPPPAPPAASVHDPSRGAAPPPPPGPEQPDHPRDTAPAPPASPSASDPSTGPGVVGTPPPSHAATPPPGPPTPPVSSAPASAASSSTSSTMPPSPVTSGPSSRGEWSPPSTTRLASVPGVQPPAPPAEPRPSERTARFRPRRAADLNEDLSKDPWYLDLEKPAETARGPPRPTKPPETKD